MTHVSTIIRICIEFIMTVSAIFLVIPKNHLQFSLKYSHHWPWPISFTSLFVKVSFVFNLEFKNVQIRESLYDVSHNLIIRDNF